MFRPIETSTWRTRDPRIFPLLIFWFDTLPWPSITHLLVPLNTLHSQMIFARCHTIAILNLSVCTTPYLPGLKWPSLRIIHHIHLRLCTGISLRHWIWPRNPVSLILLLSRHGTWILSILLFKLLDTHLWQEENHPLGRQQDCMSLPGLFSIASSTSSNGYPGSELSSRLYAVSFLWLHYANAWTTLLRLIHTGWAGIFSLNSLAMD